MDKRLARGRRLFEYHCWESKESADAKLWQHTHQRVQVLERTQHGHIDGPTPTMYRILFADGFQSEVWDDELVATFQDYERLDYPNVTE